jgi:arylsulfatase A-like enzyme
LPPALALFVPLGGPRAAETSPSRPNVLVILTDDQRWDALGVVQRELGERALFPWLKTPNLDRLAAEGARFANAFVTTSLCSPSRASLLSGRYARAHRVLNNFTEYPNDLPGYPAPAAGGRLRDGLHRQVAHGRG